MLQIIFRQFCETCGEEGGSLWSDLIIAILGGVIGTGSAILVFYLSNRRQVKIDNLKKLENQNNKLYYLASLLKSSINILKAQKDNLKRFVYDLKKDPIYVPDMSFVPMYDIKRIVEVLNLEDYFLSYTLKYGTTLENVKEYKSIISSLDFLYATFNSIVGELEKGKLHDHERKVQFNSDYQEAYEIFGRILFYLDRNQPPLRKDVTDAYKNFTDNFTNPYDLEYYYDYFIVPLHNIFAAYVSDPTNHMTEDIMSFSVKIKNLRSLFEYKKSNNVVFANDLLKYANPIIKQIKALEKDSSRLIKMLDNN